MPPASPPAPSGPNPSTTMPQNAATEQPGSLMGPYRLCELIGEGGFGNVWRAEQTEVVKREVAVKVIKTGMDTVQVLSRFNQERQALASLSHPGIATMFNAGVCADGRPYFAMELVRGGPVTAWCESHEYPVPERLRLFIQICQAVQHAHDKGILHRDLKPTNILVAEIDGQPVPKIIDFGVAMAINASAMDNLTRMTQGDQIVGTPLYMSPEQIEGRKELDARSDVYALGVLLYELLTGALPFDATTRGAAGIDAVKRLILETVPERPSTRVRRRTTTQSRHGSRQRPLPATLSSDLDWITLRALEKDRERRYPSATEFAADVQRYLDSQRVQARPPGLAHAAGRWLRRHRTASMAAAIGSVLSALFIGLPMLTKQKGDDLPGPAVLATEGTFTNSLGMKFVPVPGTEVLFCIHETRRQDYTVFADEVPGLSSQWRTPRHATPQGGVIPAGDQDDHPVVAVTWNDAQAFCQWLSYQEGRTYRLPTDAEWSAAAGLSEDRPPGTTPAMLSGKNSDQFPWGTSFPPATADRLGNFADSAYHTRFPDIECVEGLNDGYLTTSIVMSYKPGAFGIYDLAGNVSEWCSDWLDETHKSHVTRGGCYQFGSRISMLSATRNAHMGELRMSATGFRCVLERKPPAIRAVFVPPPPAPPPAYTPPKPLPPAPFPQPLPPAEVARRSITNSLGMKFIPVPGADVLFCIHETRRQDYAAFANAVPGAEPGSSWRTAQLGGIPCGAADVHPASAVNWDEARHFCRWLSKKEGRLYRLPTDREWSIAVGLGEVEHPLAETTPQQLGSVGRTEFPYGPHFPPRSTDRDGNYADQTLHLKLPDGPWIEGYDDGSATSAPAMSYKPNPFGLYDMGGNVCEWVEDWLNMAQEQHVMRGGSWLDGNADSLWSARRLSTSGSVNRPNYGFRCVLVP